VERHYSLLSDSTDRSCYRIGVLAELQGCGGSLYLHESVQAGDTLNAMPPRNSFPLEINAQHSILLAGGIGITPILSMLHALKAAGKSFELHYSAKRRSDLAFRQKIESLIGERAHFYVSQEPVQERIDLKRILAEPLPDTHVYVCGPRRMITSVLELARTAPWPMERIHYESFGITQSPDDTALTIRLSRSGKTLTVPASRSILDALLDVGLAVPYDCKRGECSLCITRVLEGEPEHRDLCLSKEEHADSMCICVSRAKTDGLTLDL
jgi:vanillate O-demethylase ferredoxin subunit